MSWNTPERRVVFAGPPGWSRLPNVTRALLALTATGYLAGLVDDHFRIAAALRDMRDRARQALGSPHDSLLGEAVRLAQVLGEHEKREHAMVDAAMSRGA